MRVEYLEQKLIRVRSMIAADWKFVRSIYLAGIATGQATFGTETPTWEDWNAAHLPTPRLAALAGDVFAGWAALSSVSKREVYAGVAEVSVYVAERRRGLGIGRALLEKLVFEPERQGIWTLQASIFPENHTSISLHQACGFRQIGIRERIGRMNGVWRNTILPERRSSFAGCDSEK